MEDIMNLTFTDERIDVSVSREVLQEIMYRPVLEADADVTESVDDILRFFIFERDESNNEYGERGKGYQWENVFLPNGTHLHMVYNNKAYHAAVKHETIIYENESYSPLKLAMKIAKTTGCDPWQDLFIQWPGSYEWEQAEVVSLKKAFKTMLSRSAERMEQEHIETNPSV